jgi:hypothetical protein
MMLGALSLLASSVVPDGFPILSGPVLVSPAPGNLIHRVGQAPAKNHLRRKIQVIWYALMQVGGANHFNKRVFPLPLKAAGDVG